MNKVMSETSPETLCSHKAEVLNAKQCLETLIPVTTAVVC